MEPGFFIDILGPSYKFTPLSPPHGLKWRFIQEPDVSRLPSLFILPDTLESRSFYAAGIPVLFYDGRDRGIPFGLDYRRYFSRDKYVLPGGFASLSGNTLCCRGKTLTLTKREEQLLFAFLSRSDKYLSLGEITHLIGKKDLKVPISRMRAKIEEFLNPLSPLRLNFHPVKGNGYYLGITVDNLWKTV